MKNLPDDILISEINLPGTHDSASRYVAFSYFAKCHNLSFQEQLEIGIRVFDIRVCKKGDRVNLVHGIVSCRKNRFGKILQFSDFCKDISVFLRNNPSEFVVVSLKCEGGEEEKETMKYLNENHIKNSDIWYTENTIPKLADVRGKAVILNRCDTYDNDRVGLCASEWICLDKATINEPHFELLPSSNGQKIMIQDMYQLKPSEKWYDAVKPLLDNVPQEEGLVLNFFSANDSVHSPRQGAKTIYRSFGKYNLEMGKKYGWIMLDFPNEEVIEKIRKSWPI